MDKISRASFINYELPFQKVSSNNQSKPKIESNVARDSSNILEERQVQSKILNKLEGAAGKDEKTNKIFSTDNSEKGVTLSYPTDDGGTRPPVTKPGGLGNISYTLALPECGEQPPKVTKPPNWRGTKPPVVKLSGDPQPSLMIGEDGTQPLPKPEKPEKPIVDPLIRKEREKKAEKYREAQIAKLKEITQKINNNPIYKKMFYLYMATKVWYGEGGPEGVKKREEQAKARQELQILMQQYPDIYAEVERDHSSLGIAYAN